MGAAERAHPGCSEAKDCRARQGLRGCEPRAPGPVPSGQCHCPDPVTSCRSQCAPVSTRAPPRTRPAALSSAPFSCGALGPSGFLFLILLGNPTSCPLGAATPGLALTPWSASHEWLFLQRAVASRTTSSWSLSSMLLGAVHLEEATQGWWAPWGPSFPRS